MKLQYLGLGVLLYNARYFWVGKGRIFTNTGVARMHNSGCKDGVVSPYGADMRPKPSAGDPKWPACKPSSRMYIYYQSSAPAVVWVIFIMKDGIYFTSACAD